MKRNNHLKSIWRVAAPRMWPRVLLALGVSCAALSPAWADSDDAHERVAVRYGDVDNFTESRDNRGEPASARRAWMTSLEKHLRTQAEKRIGAEQRLEVDITDVKRAGDFEPWHGPRAQDVRIVRDIYPPRIDLDFTLYDAAGQVVREGHRELRDLQFMMRANRYFEDPLRFEKTLIDDWLAREFAAPPAS